MRSRFSRLDEPLQHLSIVIFGAIVVMQLVRPEYSSADRTPASPISSVVAVPTNVDGILRRSCYDCHSGSTVYPWYAEVQPIGWWLADHVREGKRKLNFDAFASYRPMRQFRKLQEIETEVTKDDMPLPSYLIVHRSARLSAEEKELVIAWASAAREQMRQEHPADSLVRRR